MVYSWQSRTDLGDAQIGMEGRSELELVASGVLHCHDLRACRAGVGSSQSISISPDMGFGSLG